MDGIRELSRASESTEPVSVWFNLSYAQFLAVPRIFMEAMSLEWQRRMIACLEELNDTFDWLPANGQYWVSLRSDTGRYLALDETVCDYRHGSVEHLRRTSNEKP